MTGKNELYLNDAELNKALTLYLRSKLLKDKEVEVSLARYDASRNITIVSLEGQE